MEKSIAQSDNNPDWTRIAAELAAPFDPDDVDFRVQGRASTEGKAQILAYIDARTVQDRLDAVVGIENWSFDWTAIATDDKGEIVSVKATITVYGISKSDVGVASNVEGDKGAVSGGEKRAAVQWGIGRYLYALPATWQTVDAKGRISPATLAALRKTLPTSKHVKPSPSLPEPTPIRRVQARMEQLVPVDPTEKQWADLKLRIHKAKMCKNKDEFDRLMEQTGGDYTETLAKVEQFEQHDLHDLHDLGSSAKGRH